VICRVGFVNVDSVGDRHSINVGVVGAAVHNMVVVMAAAVVGELIVKIDA